MSGLSHKPKPKERGKERILVLGTSQLAQQIAEAIDTTPSLRSAAIGFVSEHMNGTHGTNGTHSVNGAYSTKDATNLNGTSRNGTGSVSPILPARPFHSPRRYWVDWRILRQ